VVKRSFAVGQQLEAWRFILLTNWMGDDGSCGSSTRKSADL